MGNAKARLVDQRPIPQEKVEVERPWTPPRVAHAAPRPLDEEQIAKEHSRRSGRVCDNDGIEKGTLGRPTDGGGLVDRGHAGNLADRRETVDSRGEVGGAISEIRTNTDRAAAHRTGMSPRPSGPSGRPRISWMTDVAMIGSVTKPECTR